MHRDGEDTFLVEIIDTKGVYTQWTRFNGTIREIGADNSGFRDALQAWEMSHI